MSIPSLLKSSKVKLTALLGAFALLCSMVHSQETLADRAKRISFPGQTHVNINYTARNLKLEKMTVTPNSPILEDLAAHRLTPLSSFFNDANNSLMVVITQSAEGQILFTLIKNNKIMQVQKINEISNKNIALQYGKISLNMEKPLVASTQASDIF